MSRIDPQKDLLPSILDRLNDPNSSGAAWRHGYSEAQMLAAVQRDLEDLLNTRQTSGGLGTYPEVGRSVLAYGLPDLTARTAITPQQKEAVGQLMADTVALFEPRLRDVRATLLGADDKARTVQFRIEARLRVEPAPEVDFDVVLELTTDRYTVKPREAP